MPTPDILFMQRALHLAARGLGEVSPNPMVGCVIVRDGQIIGEGYHHQYGHPHAEAEAVTSITGQPAPQAPNGLLQGCTVYVTLEPCTHQGKQPPCADLLIRLQPKRVVIAEPDPNPVVHGNGIELLQQAGIEVEVMKNQIETSVLIAHHSTLITLNRRFKTNQTQHRPHVIAKWAQTADGFLAPIDRTRTQLTGPYAQSLNHQWRTQEDAILIGPGTALADNPLLTPRLWPGRPPVRVLLWPRGLPPAHLKLLQPGSGLTTLLLNTEQEATDGSVSYLKLPNPHPATVLARLYAHGIGSLIIEGGAYTLNTFIEANLVDEYRVFASPKIWGQGLQAPHINLAPLHQTQVGIDTIYSTFSI